MRDGFDGEVLAEVPASSLADEAPLYDRPRRRPADLDAHATTTTRPMTSRSVRPTTTCSTCWSTRRGSIASTTRSSSSTPSSDRDATRRCCASRGPGLPASRARHRALDRLEPALVRARPARRHRADRRRERGEPGLRRGDRQGGRELSQLRQPRTPRGHVAALRVDRRHGRGLSWPSGFPVIGGNVSLYNESGGSDIDPTPVVGLLGVVDVARRAAAGLVVARG